MTAAKKQPHSARALAQRVDGYARDQGLAPKRVRDWVSYMVLAGRLEQANSESDGVTFTIKGAVALEMRLLAHGRATRDIDVIAQAVDEDGLAQVFENALGHNYQGFSFRIKDEPYSMLNGSVRFEVFALRGTHAWPPTVEPPETWESPFSALAAELELPVRTLAEGIEAAVAFIEEIDAS